MSGLEVLQSRRKGKVDMWPYIQENKHVYIPVAQVYIPGPYLGQITSGKRVGAQNWKRPNREMQKKKKHNQEITGKDSICSKQLKLKEKNKNKPTYWSGNKSLFVQNYRPLFLAVSPAIVMRINNPPNLNIMIQIAFVRFVRAWDWISVFQKYWFEGYPPKPQSGTNFSRGMYYRCHLRMHKIFGR